LPGAPNFVWL